MNKFFYVIFLIVFLPSLSIAQIDAEAIFVWDNDRGKSDQDNPSVGMFNNSEGFAAWDDARWGDYDVFGQEYNMERGLVGKNFPISLDGYNKFQQHHTDISCNPKNFFISVWEESLYRSDPKPSKIFACIKEKEPYLVYEHEMSQKYPSVSSRFEGWYAISWTSYTAGPEPAVLCKIYDESGSPQVMNTVCEKVHITNTVPLSNIAYCDKGGLVVYEDWLDDGSQYSIFGQYFKPGGEILDPRFKVSYYGGGSERDECDPDVAVNEAGHMVVVWEDNVSTSNQIFAQKMKAEEGSYYFIGDPFAVEPEGDKQENPRVAMFEYTGGDFSDFIVVWQEDMGTHWNVRGCVFRDQGPFNSFDIPLQNSADQKRPYAAARWGDIVSIVWSSWYYDKSHPDVFLRNFKRNDADPTGLTHLCDDIPLVAMNPDTGVGGRKCWYYDDENYDDTTTTDWNEDPIPEGSPQYVDLEYAIVDQLMELNTNGQYIIDCEDTLPFEQGDALTDYDAIFLDLGYRTTLSSAGTITQTERNELSAYVDTSSVHTGGPLMVDGNDFGYMYDTTQLFSKYFGVEFKGDGAPYTTGNIDTLYGDEDAFAKGQKLPYCYQELSDNYPDSIRPVAPNGKLILEGGDFSEWMAGYSVGSSMAWFDQGRTQYSTIYNSFIPSAITGTIHPHTYAEFYRRCLGHMGLLVQPEPIVDLSADTAGLNEGEVKLSWTIVSDDKIDDPVNVGYKLKFSRTKMTSEAEYNTAEEYYQIWETPGNVDDPASEVCYGLPPMDTLIFALKVKDEDGLYNALGAEPRATVVGDSVTPHNLLVGVNFVRDFSRRYEFLHAYPPSTENDSLFVTWDGDSFYIGITGKSFVGQGDLLIYFDIDDGQGADSTYPYNSTIVNCSPFNAAVGEFRPDFCIILETYNSCRLYECTAKDGRDIWALRTFHGRYSEDNTVNNYEYTEISIPFTDFTGYITSNQFEMVVTIQNETNNLCTHVYPVFNPIGSGTITQYYRWSRLTDNMVPKKTANIIGIEEEQVTPDVEMFGKILLAIPNPFASTIDLYLNSSIISSGKHASLRIFDVTGRLMRDFDLTPILQNHTPKVIWDGKDSRGMLSPGGIYFCELKTDEQSVIEKIIYIR